jgi:hypothetical protein
MTREILVRIISPLVTGTGAPIIFSLHRLPESNSDLEFAGPEIMLRWLASAFGRTECLNLFRSRTERRAARKHYISRVESP